MLPIPPVPLPFALLVALALGAAFARLAQGEITRAEAPLAASRGMSVALGFAALVLLPVTAYFAAFHGDWAYLYFVAWQHVPSAIDLALVLLAAACVPAGFVAGALAVRARRQDVLGGLIGAPVALLLIVTMAFTKRLVVSASAAQYAGGFGVEPIAASALGKGVVWALLAMAAGVALAVRALRTTA
jgi:hypothetical protein